MRGRAREAVMCEHHTRVPKGSDKDTRSAQGTFSPEQTYMQRNQMRESAMTVSKMLIASMLLGAGVMIAGCEPSKQNGSAEKAGEKIDNAMDDMTKDGRDITDGPAENL